MPTKSHTITTKNSSTTPAGHHLFTHSNNIGYAPITTHNGHHHEWFVLEHELDTSVQV